MNEFTRTGPDLNVKNTNKPLYYCVIHDLENKGKISRYYGLNVEINVSYVKFVGVEIPESLAKTETIKNITSIVEVEKLNLEPVCLYVGWPNIIKIQVLSYKKASTIVKNNEK